MNELVENKNTYDLKDLNVMVMDNVPEYDNEDYDLFNPKDFKKYIKDIERDVRNSREYRVAIQYLKQYMGMNKSPFLENIEYTDSNRVHIELHHSPFTLFDIVVTIFNKRQRMKEPLDLELVAEEVTYLHYLLLVGLIPLSKTEHELVHNQSLFVPLNIIMGRFEEWIEMYRQDIPNDAMERYQVYKELTDTYNHQENMKVLDVNPQYLSVESSGPTMRLGTYDNVQLQQLAAVATNRIEAKRSNNHQLEDNKYDNNTSKLVNPFKRVPAKMYCPFKRI